jgi:hypothetical protein
MTTHRIETNNEYIETIMEGVSKSYKKVREEIAANKMPYLNDGTNPRPSERFTYNVSIKF